MITVNRASGERLEQALEVATTFSVPWLPTEDNPRYPDFLVRVEASFIVVEPTNPRARRWLVEHTSGDLLETSGGFAVERGTLMASVTASSITDSKSRRTATPLSATLAETWS